VYIEVHDASRKLTAHAHGVTVGLSLGNGIGRVNEQYSHYGDARHHQCEHGQRCQQRFVLLADYGSLFVFFHYDLVLLDILDDLDFLD
jgi:hypothetical protein